MNKNVMRKIIAIFLSMLMVTGTVTVGYAADGGSTGEDTDEDLRVAEIDGEHRGLWIAFVDFSTLGLKNKSKSKFRTNIRKVIDDAKEIGCNEIYFHVRAFNDASWESETFKASKYLDSDATSSKTAAETYSYDPLQIVIEETHDAGLDIHAWLNPYRMTYNTFMNPANTYSTKRIQIAVDELSQYDLDGIHFDDYFYHAKKGYATINETNYDKSHVSWSNTGYLKVANDPSAANKRKNVNKMVQAVYEQAKENDLYFSISPQGNLDNARGSGCDINKWLSTDEYCDAVIPQIYWTDRWGSDGKTKMFSNRLSAWSKLHTDEDTELYIGLALYRTGQKFSDDKGWGIYKTAIRAQIKKLRNAGAGGYVLYASQDLYDSHAKTEVDALKSFIK